MTWNEPTGQTGQTDAATNQPSFGVPSAVELQGAAPLANAGGDMLSQTGLPATNSGHDLPREAYAPATGPINPLIPQGQPTVSQPAVALASGMPPGPLPVQTAAAPNDDDSGADDVVWVNRAKRIIASTQGDPHRQVQLLQQLSVVYLKERYGRTVRADEV